MYFHALKILCVLPLPHLPSSRPYVNLFFFSAITLKYQTFWFLFYFVFLPPIPFHRENIGQSATKNERENSYTLILSLKLPFPPHCSSSAWNSMTKKDSRSTDCAILKGNGRCLPDTTFLDTLYLKVSLNPVSVMDLDVKNKNLFVMPVALQREQKNSSHRNCPVGNRILGSHIL